MFNPESYNQSPNNYGPPQNSPNFHLCMVALVTTSRVPVFVQCIYCLHEDFTKTVKMLGDANICWGVACCVCCGPLGLIPFCHDKWKNVLHRCSNCNANLGITRG